MAFPKHERKVESLHTRIGSGGGRGALADCLLAFGRAGNWGEGKVKRPLPPPPPFPSLTIFSPNREPVHRLIVCWTDKNPSVTRPITALIPDPTFLVTTGLLMISIGKCRKTHFSRIVANALIWASGYYQNKDWFGQLA